VFRKSAYRLRVAVAAMTVLHNGNEERNGRVTNAYHQNTEEKPVVTKSQQINEKSRLLRPFRQRSSLSFFPSASSKTPSN
jgi:hypothetical protein